MVTSHQRPKRAKKRAKAHQSAKQTTPLSYDADCEGSPSRRRSTRRKIVAADPPSQEPLSYEEQEALSQTINEIPDMLLPGIFDILKKGGAVDNGANLDDDDISLDLDMDELSTGVQRELQQFVMKNTRPTNVVPRVSDASESSTQQDPDEEEGVTRTETNDLIEMIRGVQNQIVDLHNELLAESR